MPARVAFLRRRSGFVLVWLTAWLSLLAGCSPSEPPLRVGSYPWPGFASLYHAQVRGWLDPEHIQLINFDSAGEVLRAFREGSIDAAGITLDEAVLLASNGPPGRVVMVFDFSRGADVLLARPSIARLQELRGKRLGVESGAEGGYILARVLDWAGLKAEEVQVVQLPLNEHEQAYRSGRVDAIITMDPVRVRLLSAGARELFSSSQIMGELLDVLFVREQVLQTHPRTLQALVNAHFRSLNDIRGDPGAAARGLGERFGPPGNLLGAWDLIEFAGRSTNARMLSGSSARESAARIQKVLRRQGAVGNPAAPLPEIDDRFVRDGD